MCTPGIRAPGLLGPSQLADHYWISVSSAIEFSVPDRR